MPPPAKERNSGSPEQQEPVGPLRNAHQASAGAHIVQNTIVRLGYKPVQPRCINNALRRQRTVACGRKQPMAMRASGEEAQRNRQRTHVMFGQGTCRRRATAPEVESYSRSTVRDCTTARQTSAPWSAGRQCALWRVDGGVAHEIEGSGECDSLEQANEPCGADVCLTGRPATVNPAILAGCGRRSARTHHVHKVSRNVERWLTTGHSVHLPCLCEYGESMIC
jgi:hypothetical protein